MKVVFLLPLICLFGKSPHILFSKANPIDTTIITHLLDGRITEWPAEKFNTDKATEIKYAVDNDNQTLFIFTSITNSEIQKKIMHRGLNLFIDVKGKKKENQGVEFPLIMDEVVSIVNMRVFGLDNSSGPVSIKTEGTINIALAWDSSFAMNIEYSIPLKMLETSISELNNKKISIGWKIEEPDMTSNTSQQPVSTNSRLVGISASGRPSSNRSTGPTTNNNTFPQSSNSKSKSFWTSHTIIL